MRSTLLLGATLLSIAGCGPALPPPGLTALERTLDGDRSAAAAESAPESWSEALRYLRLGRRSHERGDLENAARFAELGRLHARIALVGLREQSARERIESARQERARLELELERVEDAKGALEQQLERERIRAHLVTVVEENRRKAAAEEELREQGLPTEDRQAIGEARLEVGRAMIGRIEVFATVLEALVRTGNLRAERRLPVDGALAAARDALAAKDLAAVHQQVEAAGVASRRLFDELWPAERIGAALDELTSIVEPTGRAPKRAGHWLWLEAEGRNKKKIERRTKAIVDELAAALENTDAPAHELLTVSVSAGNRDTTLILLLPLPRTEER